MDSWTSAVSPLFLSVSHADTGIHKVIMIDWFLVSILYSPSIFTFVFALLGVGGISLFFELELCHLTCFGQKNGDRKKGVSPKPRHWENSHIYECRPCHPCPWRVRGMWNSPGHTDTQYMRSYVSCLCRFMSRSCCYSKLLNFGNNYLD